MNQQLRETIRNEISAVLDREPDRGLIHTVSYHLANTLRGLSPRLIFHRPDDKKDRFRDFLETPGAIFVSPSSMRGLDLYDDRCRWIYWLKCPFLDLGDKHTQTRLYGSGKWGRQWYISEAISNILQGCGRGVRNEKDWCRVYLGDKQIGRLLEQHTGLWPRWFREAVSYEQNND